MGEYVKNRSISLVDGTILFTTFKGNGCFFGLGLYYVSPLKCFQSKKTKKTIMYSNRDLLNI